MKVITLRGHTNIIILIAILVLNTFYKSELGGPGTIFNTISFLLVLVFLFLNSRINTHLLFFFTVPILFLLLSVAFNLPTLHPGAFRSALATTAGYALLTLKPLPLNITQLRRLTNLYLMICLALSIYFTMDTLAIGVLRGNANFNVNPNSASILFFGCLILSFVFGGPRLKWFFAIAFTLLLLTTGSRSGLVSIAVLWAGYIWFSTVIQSRSFLRSFFTLTKSKLRVLSIAAIIPILAFYFFPWSIEVLSARISTAGLSLASTTAQGHGGRDEIWQSAFNVSQQSVATILFGTGPATASGLIGSGTHSSYVEVITSVGVPFMICTMLAMITLFRYHIRHSQREFLLYAVPILVYGAFETVLFEGMGSLWYILIFLSLYYRCIGYSQPLGRG